MDLEEHKASLLGEPYKEVYTNGDASHINIKNLEIASYLGLKESVFDPDVMEKVSALSDYFESIEDLKEIDFKLGNPADKDRLHKIYIHTLLNKEENEYRRKISLIEEQKQKMYGSS